MLKIGEKQRLIVIERKEFGVYLAEEKSSSEKVLLPIKQVPEEIVLGDSLEVFLYRDSKDRIIATTNEPKLTLGRVAKLRVKEVGRIGAFLDWGLEKDLLLPYKEQTYNIKNGDEVIVAMYLDKSSRLCATMKIYRYLQKAEHISKDDQVTGTVYEISKEYGAYVAIDDRYTALIPKKELVPGIKEGDVVHARVTAIKADGKIDLSVKEKAYIQMSIDADKLVQYMEQHGSKIPFNDKADPELIKQTMGMSKNEFKRAVGTLLKAGKIEITPDSIVLK